MINQCIKCKKGNVDYSMSDIQPIYKTTPQEVGIEGICLECSTHYYLKFKHYETEVTQFDSIIEENEKKEVIKIPPT